MRGFTAMGALLVMAALAQAPGAHGELADAERLADVLARQPETLRARYAQRHPQETLTFFGIAPGMTVVEVLPGEGWYSRILLEYLGADGRLIGADYPFAMLAKLGFLEGERLEARRRWAQTWSAEAESWRSPGAAAVSAYTLDTLPAALDGQVDAVLFIRALHNLARVESDGGYLTAALADARRVLKPGGVLGVVQHEARPETSDAWADGANGYLKRAFVLDRIAAAGFEFEAASDVNANPKDRPGESDRVWRLPPSLSTSRDAPALRAQLEGVGESHRMTLRFRKPVE